MSNQNGIYLAFLHPDRRIDRAGRTQRARQIGIAYPSRARFHTHQRQYPLACAVLLGAATATPARFASGLARTERGRTPESRSAGGTYRGKCPHLTVVGRTRQPSGFGLTLIAGANFGRLPRRIAGGFARSGVYCSLGCFGKPRIKSHFTNTPAAVNALTAPPRCHNHGNNINPKMFVKMPSTCRLSAKKPNLKIKLP